MRGTFVVIEGADGVGKTTVANRVAARLTADGYDVLLTAQPSRSVYGIRVRELLQTAAPPADEMLQLFIDDRREHLQSVIRPALERGAIVISDRYRYSTVCYQHLQGFTLEHLVELNAEFAAPDLVVVMLVHSETAMRRLLTRPGRRDLFEDPKSIERIQSLFRRMPAYYRTDHFLFVDAELPTDRIADEIISAITARRV